jgi:hypothetical protein
MADSNETLNQGQTGDGGGGQPSTEGSGPVDLKTLTKEQLLAFAEKIGTKAKPAMSKEEIIKSIEDFQETKGMNEEPTDPPTGNGEAKERAKTNDTEPVGTIRIDDGVEYVKVSADKWVPTIRDNITSDKPAVVVSKKRAGKTIYAKTGKPITFDGSGRATVSADDARYLTSIVIDEVPEYTVEENE